MHKFFREQKKHWGVGKNHYLTDSELSQNDLTDFNATIKGFHLSQSTEQGELYWIQLLNKVTV